MLRHYVTPRIRSSHNTGNFPTLVGLNDYSRMKNIILAEYITSESTETITVKKSRLLGAVCACFSLTFGFPVFSAPVELITNGGFETGNFTGWTINDLTGGSGSFFIDDGDGFTPSSSGSTVGPATGAFYAVSDQTGPGTHALSQAFTVSGPVTSAILSFDMFINDYGSGPVIDPIGLDHTVPSNQHARVDILGSSPSAFDTRLGGAGVLANYYIGNDGSTNPHTYINYLIDITSIVGFGGTFTLRFAEVDNQGNFNQGIDNVSIQVSNVPIPAAVWLFGSGLIGLVGMARRKKAA